MLFEYEVGPDSTHAVITHFWAAGSGGIDSTLIKYYVDDESEPSIEFTPSTAAGVGFGQQDVFALFSAEAAPAGGTKCAAGTLNGTIHVVGVTGADAG